MAEAQDLGWCIVELMGHRRLGGSVREHLLAGTPFIRVDVPAPDGEGNAATQFYSPSAVYCITPTTEETARALSRREQPAPVQRWELTPKPEPRREVSGGDELVDDTLGDDDVGF